MIKTKGELIAKLEELRGMRNKLDKQHQANMDTIDRRIEKLEDFAYGNATIESLKKT